MFDERILYLGCAVSTQSCCSLEGLCFPRPDGLEMVQEGPTTWVAGSAALPRGPGMNGEQLRQKQSSSDGF